MFEEIVGSSDALKAVLSRLAKVAPTDSTVLIVGETGTGKELIARAVHKRSQRAARAFVSVNCAALAPTLITSELFGHERGAFTGANNDVSGASSWPMAGRFSSMKSVNSRPRPRSRCCGCCRNASSSAWAGHSRSPSTFGSSRRLTAISRRRSRTARFREDLFYRLNVFPIEVPPLRARKDDVRILVEYFVRRYASRAGKTIRSIEKKTLDLLQAYAWPGNIRELQNVIERSVILSASDVFAVDESWLPAQTVRPRTAGHLSAPPRGEPRSEREIIEAALAECRGRVAGSSGAAARLGVAPSTLDHRIKALRIDKAQFKFR